MEGEARDLLRRFSGGFSPEEMTGGDSDEIELGLSLGGCFSSQNAEKNRLVRSSSIPAMIQSDFPSVLPLIRCCSMPSEVEEEIRRRREMQSVKRMEAKRKRKEKRKFRRFEEGSVGKMGRFEGEEKGVEGSRRMGVGTQGSVASQGSTSSGGSEFESRLGQDFEFPVIISASDANSPSNMPTTSKHNNNIAHSVSTTTSKSINDTINGVMFNSNILRKNEGERSRNSGLSGAEKNMMEEMPSVSTRGSGPNGQRVDGFLYRYEQGEVSIVCVCHGRFLTPAEFVKHGGGGDVAHPLRHIVVNPSSGSFS